MEALLRLPVHAFSCHSWSNLFLRRYTLLYLIRFKYLNYGNQILLCKRSIEPRAGYWTLPAGFLENGESTLDGALRECVEEANATMVNPHLYAIFDIPEINQVYIFYRAELAEPSFGPSLESSEVALFDEADIPWSKLAFPMVEEALDFYLEDRKIGDYSVKRKDIRRPWKSRHTNA